MAVRFVDRTTATVRLAAGTMDVLLAASDVRSGVDRGDGTLGTAAISGVDPSDIVDPAYVIVGHDNYTGGEAGTFVVPSESDVRYGTEYGSAAEFTGTLAVPDYSSVTADAGRVQQICEALVALLDAADIAGAFFETLGAERTYTEIADLSEVGEDVRCWVAPQMAMRERNSNGTYGRYVVIDILMLAHLTNDASSDLATEDNRRYLSEQVENFLAAEANSDLELPDGAIAEYVEPTDRRAPAEVKEGLCMLWDSEDMMNKRQDTGLVRVAYWVDESY